MVNRTPRIESMIKTNQSATDDYLCSIAISLMRIADILDAVTVARLISESPPLSEAGPSTASIYERH
jgi:hypothetical protein